MSWLQALLEERRGETALTTAMAGLRLPDTEAMEWGRGGGRIGPSDEQVNMRYFQKSELSK